MKIAPPAPSMVPKGMVGPSLLSQVVASKFVDAVPFYRQVKILERHGITLGRSTLCGWVLEAAGRAEVLKTLLWEKLLAGPLIQADETTVQVLEEPGRENTSKSWMWVYRGGEPERPVVLFEYDRSRAGLVPMGSLRYYRGYLQTDGYQGYNAIGNQEGIVHVGCLAHIRRKFHEAERVAPKSGQAREALEYIRSLYAVESRADELKLSADERRALRQKASKPILETFRGWLELKQTKVLPEGPLGNAITYALGQWEAHDPLPGGRDSPSGQQPRGERDPAVLRGTTELAVQRESSRSLRKRDAVHPDRVGQGEPSGAVSLPPTPLHETADRDDRGRDACAPPDEPHVRSDRTPGLTSTSLNAYTASVMQTNGESYSGTNNSTSWPNHPTRNEKSKDEKPENNEVKSLIASSSISAGGIQGYMIVM